MYPHDTTKCCTRCGETKPLEAFPPARQKRDGLSSWCRECTNKQRRKATKDDPEYQARYPAFEYDPHQKRCPACGQTKPRSEFTGGRGECRPCAANAMRERRHSDPEFHERQIKSQRASWRRRMDDPTSAEAIRTQSRERQRRALQDPVQKEKKNAYYRIYNKHPDRRTKHAENFRTYRQKRQRTDPTYHEHLMDLAKRGQHKRRARLLSVGGSYTKEQWDQLCALYGHCCVKCGATGPLSVDHVVPLSRGGSNDVSNLQPLCRSCNSRKHTKIVDYRPFLPVEMD